MRTNRNRDIRAAMAWTVGLRTNDVEGKRGLTTIRAFSRGKLSAAGLKRRVKSLIECSKQFDGAYAGVAAMDMEDFETFDGRSKAVPLADACWRLRNQSDLGAKPGAKIEYADCVMAQEVETCMNTLEHAGFNSIARVPGDDNWSMSVNVSGANNEKRLKA
jgi:hypothetical protein